MLENNKFLFIFITNSYNIPASKKEYSNAILCDKQNKKLYSTNA